MKFGPVPVADAEGAILAHSLKLDGKRLKKGHVLQASDIESIREMGVDEVVVAQLGPNDVEENQAAKFVADTMLEYADGLRAAEPFTGRVNIYATKKGLFRPWAYDVDDVNSINPAITLATLPGDTLVEEGRMVATVKIIPFSVKKAWLEELTKLAGSLGFGPLDLKAVEAKRVGLVATELPSLKSSVMDKTTRILKERLEPFGSTLEFEDRIAHNEVALSEVIERRIDSCDLLIVFGASAITDRKDVIPAGIERAGGHVSAFGMPVDPGNLLLSARMRKKDIIGAPGCARSPAENGFDRVLKWAHAGLSIDNEQLSRLGVGGLLMEIHDRPQPREG